MNYKEKLAEAGAALPALLFPAKQVNLQKFACIACDQHSADPSYWQEVRAFAGAEPSACKLILPEALLPAKSSDIERIQEEMRRYLTDGTLQNLGEGLMYIHRQTTGGIRKGILLLLDLDCYDYSPGAKSLIRPTEKTVAERLPARVEIRKNAALDLPHVMVLTADKKLRLSTLLDAYTADKEPLYDFELMQKSGRLTGWFLQDEEILDQAAEILLTMKNEALDGMLYAVGDGNHSFAAAKNCGDRFALAEIVDLYDPALTMEPIHRLLMHVNPEEVCRDLHLDPKNPPDLQELQPRLDAWLAAHPESSLEYIHGKKEAEELGKKPGNLAIVWNEFPKDRLFENVTKHGVLQRKSFSLGEACDKRFYLECTER